MGFNFIGELLYRNNTSIWFIYPYNKDFRDDLIVFSDEIKESVYWQRDIYDLTIEISEPNRDLDLLFKETFRETNIFYSDDLTGTDFKQAIDFTIRK